MFDFRQNQTFDIFVGFLQRVKFTGVDGEEEALSFTK